MTHYSARAQWNTANARLANKPFDDLFAEKPIPDEIERGIRHTGARCPHCKQLQQITRVYETPKLRQHMTPDGKAICEGSRSEVKC
jgi:phage FluMu protein Com